MDVTGKLKALGVRVLNFIGLVASYVPQPYPDSQEALQLFIAEVIRLGQFPDNLSFQTAIAKEILHTDMRVILISKRYYVRRVRRVISNQLSFGMIEAEKKAASAEAVQTTSSEVV